MSKFAEAIFIRMKLIHAITASAILLSASLPLSTSAATSKVKGFAPADVTLLESPFQHARDLDIKVIKQYDMDRLLAPFLIEAGLQPKAKKFENWAGLDGHVTGHYLSALAMAYATTGDQECKQRLDYMISELKRCQDANGNGYLGGIPDATPAWEALKAGDEEAIGRMWVPWYNLHKVYAGLRDAWTYAGNADAKDMFLKFCDWGAEEVANLDDKQMEKMLDTEFGGMNEVFVDAYELTSDPKYLQLAKRFTHHRVFDPLSSHRDSLDNMHANTQVPKFVGFQRVAEVTGDSTYHTAADFFWETVVGNRSLSFGGNSRREQFPSAASCREYTEERDGPESCNTYNMLKLAEGLFRMNPDSKYSDYYERAMYNHILSTQHPEHGGFVYFTSVRPRHYRVYSAPNEAMWCCVGTGMENHLKYNEFIYQQGDGDLYVNLFLPSQLSWAEKGLKLTQTTGFPAEEATALTLDLKKPQKFALKIRKPGWLKDGKWDVKVNGKSLKDSESAEDGYLAINRKWKDGDKVEISLPMATTIEAMPNVPDFISILHGPIVLANRMGTENLDGLIADDGRWAHMAHGKLLTLAEAPMIVGEKADVLAKIQGMKPVEGKPLHFTCPGLFLQPEYQDVEFEPFSGIHDSRYSVYWQAMTPEEHASKLKSQRVDKVETGE